MVFDFFIAISIGSFSSETLFKCSGSHCKLRDFSALLKYLLKVSAMSLSSHKFSSSTIRLILENTEVYFSLNNSFSVFPNLLLSLMSLIFKLL